VIQAGDMQLLDTDTDTDTDTKWYAALSDNYEIAMCQ
jgi:hypothetical protein